MARIDYNAIGEAIRELLVTDPQVSPATGAPIIELEGNAPFSDQGAIDAERTPYVGIYLTGRDAPADDQRLRAGQTTTMRLRYTLLVVTYAADGVESAIRARNDLIGKVEVALMTDRTLGGTVDFHVLDGGDMPSARVGNGFAAFGDVLVTAQTTATTT